MLQVVRSPARPSVVAIVVVVVIAMLAGCSSPEPPPAGDDAAIPDAPDTPPDDLRLVLPGAQQVDEERALAIDLRTEGGAGTPRVFVEGLPPGAIWDEAAGRLSFTPDFTQGGATWQVTVTADDGRARVTGAFDIAAIDTIRPPAPVIESTTIQAGHTRLRLIQATDAFLDSPGYAGRSFTAVVTVPSAASMTNRLPVRVGLHGFSSQPSTDGSSTEFRIYPHDPANTYWWGYSALQPGTAGNPMSGAVPAYTIRRVLHLLEWVLATYPGADPDRVYLDGDSMGGAGAMVAGVLHARHFCHVRAAFGQAIAKHHRPSRVSQLAGFWGVPALDLDDGGGLGVWSRQDLARALRDDPVARDQFLSIKNSKDDPSIHFGAVILPSPITGTSFYGALQGLHVGHHAIWDEGGHFELDPVLGNNWWTAGWDPVVDPTSSLARRRAFPAFSRASIDRDPGTGAGNGQQAWNPESGYAGAVSVAGDTGWDGERAGGLNRFLRWDATKIVDTIDRFELPLRVIDGAGGPPPAAGYPTTGDRLDGALPVTVDVTPRRVQAFRCRPGERIRWQIGAQQGVATADATGAVTVPGVSLDTAWATLVLTRDG